MISHKLTSSVFGRVIHNLELIQQIGKLEVDGKDRPISPVVIAHCGELELRRPAAPDGAGVGAGAGARDDRPAASRARSSSRSRSRSRSRSPPRRRRYSTSPSDSGSDSSYTREKKARRRERDERRARKQARRDRKNGDSRDTEGGERGERGETEAELDARLEREEKERLAMEAEERARRDKEQRERAQGSGGVVYKGEPSFLSLRPGREGGDAGQDQASLSRGAMRTRSRRRTVMPSRPMSARSALHRCGEVLPAS